MILKKPFGFLIKYFRLIHLLLSTLIGYLLIKTMSIFSFISNYLKLPNTLIEPVKNHELFPKSIYLVSISLIIGSIMILVLMKFKKKPVKIYIFTFLVVLFSIIGYLNVYSMFHTLEVELVDIRTLKFNQDIISTLFFLQAVCTLLLIVRATGFNIHKFNFTFELDDMNIEVEDSEEFEVNVELDSSKYKRRLKRIIRYGKYIFKENKLLLLFLTLLIFLFITIIILLNIFVFHKIYKLGDLIETENFNFVFNEGYQTIYDSKMNSLEDKAYIIVSFSVTAMGGEKTKIETSNLSLELNDHHFYHKEDNTSFLDLGVTYQNEKVGESTENYILLFEIPKNFLGDKMYLLYKQSLGKNIKIRVKPKNLDIEKKQKNYKLGSTIHFQGSKLGNATLTINNFDIASNFKNKYVFCVSKDECYDSYEYIIPTFQDNYDKVLVKINAEFKGDEENNLSNIKSVESVFNTFARIEYQLENGEKYSSNNFRFIYSKKIEKDNNYYIESDKNILNATEIKIIFNIRDREYCYRVR